MHASGRGSDHLVFASGTCRVAIVSNAPTISRYPLCERITRSLGSSSDVRPKRQLEGGVEEGDQAVVTTMAQHVDAPPRRYPWGRPESKYIESPESSACSWPSMWTFNLPLSV